MPGKERQCEKRENPRQQEGDASRNGGDSEDFKPPCGNVILQGWHVRIVQVFIELHPKIITVQVYAVPCGEFTGFEEILCKECRSRFVVPEGMI